MLHLLGSDITEPRHNLVTGLGAMNAAALALRWLRRALPPMLSDERIWVLTQTWLDLLDARPPANARAADARAAEFGLRLLGFLGWALQLERCVRCGTVCPPGRSSYLVLSAGGIVCRACGGAGLILEPTLRAQLVALEGELFLDEDLGAKALKLLEGAFSLHLGIES
jgi:DNA repair protein RecO (recombination protein O)